MTVLSASGLSKSYGGVAALENADLEIRKGEVHAVVGANGAGKSTLAKILAGAERPDSGELAVDGRRIELASPLDAARAGIAVVSQELCVFPDLDVLTNLFMPAPPTRGAVLTRSGMRAAAEPLLRRMQLEVDLDAPLRSLSLAQCQLVEITRALIRKPRVLILDEPNSALQADATERLLGVIRSMRDSGVGIVFVSHFLEEVFAVSDVVTVVRDGRTVLSRYPVSELSIEGVVAQMLGGHRPPSAPAQRQARAASGAPLTVRGLASGRTLSCATFEARPGEVVALVGLDGSGPHAALDVLFGRARADSGTVALPDGSGPPRNMALAVKRGIAYVPADRKNHALMLEDSVSTNISLVRSVVLGRDERFPSPRRARRRALARIRDLGVKAASPDMPVSQLSGGNQQKVVLGKWLEVQPHIVLLDDPTRGVDVAAKSDLHRVIREAADSGRIVVVTTSELAEAGQLADRIVVFYRGRTVGELRPQDAEEETLLTAINTGRLPAGALPAAT